MKKALVLEGGALRGLFSAGVMDVMMEHGITFDGAIGVSAGAAFGSNYVSRQPGRAIRYNKRFAKDWRYCSLRSWITTGDLFGADYAYHILPTSLDIFDNEAFEENPMAFYVVCTDVETGKAIYKRCDKGGDDFFDWVRASASMPFVSRIVEMEGHKMLDGGVADSIPLRFMEGEGYDHNVVVLTQPEGYQKRHNRFMPLLRIALRKYPLMVEALDKRHLMYNEQTAYVKKREAEGDIFVIQPDASLPIGHTSHNPDEMQRVYDLGRRKAEQKMQELQAFLKRGEE